MGNNNINIDVDIHIEMMKHSQYDEVNIPNHDLSAFNFISNISLKNNIEGIALPEKSSTFKLPLIDRLYALLIKFPIIGKLIKKLFPPITHSVNLKLNEVNIIAQNFHYDQSIGNKIYYISNEVRIIWEHEERVFTRQGIAGDVIIDPGGELALQRVILILQYNNIENNDVNIDVDLTYHINRNNKLYMSSLSLNNIEPIRSSLNYDLDDNIRFETSGEINLGFRSPNN